MCKPSAKVSHALRNLKSVATAENRQHFVSKVTFFIFCNYFFFVISTNAKHEQMQITIIVHVSVQIVNDRVIIFNCRPSAEQHLLPAQCQQKIVCRQSTCAVRRQYRNETYWTQHQTTEIETTFGQSADDVSTGCATSIGLPVGHSVSVAASCRPEIGLEMCPRTRTVEHLLDRQCVWRGMLPKHATLSENKSFSWHD